MVQAWYYNTDSSVDARERHEYDPPRPVTLDQLSAIGVLHWEFDVSNTDTLNERVQALMTERNYKNKDVVCIRWCIDMAKILISVTQYTDLHFQRLAPKL